ncbi:hypothetical protein ACFSAV_00705 [Pasteurella oralis]|uniref:Uncharacterized protein n=2 Tax=Pasteurella oralis TaxID=1071947 RepID=A0ABW4NQM8_9PAST
MKMNLFNECKIALHNSISVITKETEKQVIDLLNTYPIKDNWIDFNLAHYKEYEHIEMLPKEYYSNDFFVLADDIDIPIFQANLKEIVENFHHVSCLCPILFIFNQECLILRDFSTDKVRVIYKPL